MPRVFQIFSQPDCQYIEVAESSQGFFRPESRRGSGGSWAMDDGKSKKDKWKPVELYVRNPLDTPSDIYKFNANTLIFEDRAKRILESIIEDCGEVYYQPFEGRMHHVFNAMKFIPAPQGDDDFPNEGLFYDLKDVSSSLVRLPWGTIVAISGVTPPELDFKLQVEKANLNGLAFREVWDSENYVPYVAPAEDEDE